MKERTAKILFKGTICVCAAMLAFAGLCVCYKYARRYSVAPGQVWVTMSTSPFDPDHYYLASNYVVAVKGGYVQFINQSGRTNSEELDWFVAGAKRIP